MLRRLIARFSKITPFDILKDHPVYGRTLEFWFRDLRSVKKSIFFVHYSDIPPSSLPVSYEMLLIPAFEEALQRGVWIEGYLYGSNQFTRKLGLLCRSYPNLMLANLKDPLPMFRATDGDKLFVDIGPPDSEFRKPRKFLWHKFDHQIAAFLVEKIKTVAIRCSA